ncbi:MAG TPA: hypothetical protein VGR45_00695 [Stellaceae bacterium]|nr:hypothetical protein [Stellaceae bacterium]
MTSAYADQIAFSSGVLAMTAVGSVDPVRFAIVQDVQIENAPELKSLYGRVGRYPLALAPGKTKLTVNAKTADIRASLYYQCVFGGTLTSAETKFADNEAQTVATSVTVTNAATFIANQGVRSAVDGTWFKGVASSPAAAEYSVDDATGVYTFNSGDDGTPVLISYTYSTTGGNLLTFGNPAMGVGPVFSAIFANAYDGREQVWTFTRCQSSRLMLPTKVDDFTISEFNFEVSQDISGSIGSVSSDN